jgi:hypothetical protein
LNVQVTMLAARASNYSRELGGCAAVTDKGYDAKAKRDGARRRGIAPVIPYKSKRGQPTRVLSESTLQGTGPYRPGGWQAQ